MQHLVHVIGQVLTADGDLSRSEGNRVTFINWHGVCDSLTAVQDGTCSLTVSEQGKHCLIAEVELWDIELIKHEIDQLFSNLWVIVWWLSDDDFVLFESALHDIVHKVKENLLHLSNVLNSATDNGVLDI